MSYYSVSNGKREESTRYVMLNLNLKTIQELEHSYWVACWPALKFKSKKQSLEIPISYKKTCIGTGLIELNSVTNIDE